MKKILILFLFIGINLHGQNLVSREFTYNEFIGYVKKYHPLVKNANLEINKAQANMIVARGGFDPNIEVDFSKKQFKNNEYYSILNSSFKIPTWYGIDIKAGFDNSEGIYLNPENTLPNQGLTSLGISVPLGQGLIINQRMADLRKAKVQIQLSQSERKIEAIGILFDASVAYFNWKKTFSEFQLYEEFTKNAQIRFEGIQSLIKQGDKPAIDSIEAGIIVKNRLLGIEESRLKLAKAKLELSNYLWLENNIPFELSDDLIPEINLELSNGSKFIDVEFAKLLSKSGTQTEHMFNRFQDLSIGDSIILFNNETNTIEEVGVTNIQYSYETINVYSVDVEPIDVFLTSEEGVENPIYAIYQHNPAGQCKMVCCSGSWPVNNYQQCATTGNSGWCWTGTYDVCVVSSYPYNCYECFSNCAGSCAGGGAKI